MKILVVGSGAREHALCRTLDADSATTAVHVTPGNPGMAECATVHDVGVGDRAGLVALAGELDVDLVVVGPEAPLVDGLADALEIAGIPCCGPSAQAAMLEGSKAFAKSVMAAAEVPTAAAHPCHSIEEVRAAMRAFGAPYVIKDDGLAGGKGVVVTASQADALDHAEKCLAAEHGMVIVEEYLDGPEFSVFCLSDGERVIPLPAAQDYKRALDGDRGPNTGGMGAYSPLPWAPEGIEREVAQRVAGPVVAEMASRGTPFRGVLYCGLALTADGIKVVEFNVRFGDPDGNAVLGRITDRLAPALLACATGSLSDDAVPTVTTGACVTLVLASAGYPSNPTTGRPIGGSLQATDDTYILHAGTARGDEGKLLASGGRVLGVTSVAADLASAREACYKRISDIELEGSHYRSDIAADDGINA